METLVISFTINGNLRFLSHRQTATMLQRALIRAGLDLSYSEGFNPHPRMSLPLPRTVGVVSQNDLLTAELDSTDTFDRSQIKDRVTAEVPECCRIEKVFICPPKTSFKPHSVWYELTLKESALNANFMECYERLAENIRTGNEIPVERKGPKRKRAKTVNVGAFIESAELDNETVRLQCSISPSGSIRPGEILELLGLGTEMLSEGIVRKDVKWDPALDEAYDILDN